MWLETNSALAPALSLYRSFGFKQIPEQHQSDYARADVQMELTLFGQSARGRANLPLRAGPRLGCRKNLMAMVEF